MNTIKLSGSTLREIAGRGVRIPRYDRAKRVPRVVHIGLGHFHRAHQAFYIDELLEKGLAAGTGIFEVNLVADSFPLARISASQDYLYTLICRGDSGDETAVVAGSIAGYLNAVSDPRGVVERLAADSTEVISLTITEKGYYYDAAAGEPAWDADPVKHDLEYPQAPVTAAGYLAAALDLRGKNGGGKITIMSCDNFPSNGTVLKNCVLSLCRKTRPGLVSWIEENAAFPLSMVDRITPATSPVIIGHIEERYGIEDGWPVCSEDFRQWVLEDNFSRPSGSGFDPALLAEAGVQVVKDVEPYELMKIRLLNGSHSALAYPSYLMGFRGVAEAISDPLLGRYIRDKYMEEISPTLHTVPGMDLPAYKDTLIRRFSNKNIADTILRLAAEGSKKIPNFIFNPLEEALERNLPHGAVVFALAAWARFLAGTDENGAVIPLDDPLASVLSEAAKGARNNPERFLRAAGIKRGEHALALADEFGASLDAIYRKGTRAALEALTGGRPTD
ncbi:MAG: mannitol dehydrogenase family protein [Treponema sp.]|jgi:mannitol-1-phosphate/altronate dehydrogenase|nr:mannitol dehydrogenase family protein [Treponema sp.]